MEELIACAILWRCGAGFHDAYLSCLNDLFERNSDSTLLLELEIASDDVDDTWRIVEDAMPNDTMPSGRAALKTELVRALARAYNDMELRAFVGVARSVWLLVGRTLDSRGDMSELCFADDFINDEGGMHTRAYYEDLFKRFDT